MRAVDAERRRRLADSREARRTAPPCDFLLFFEGHFWYSPFVLLATRPEVYNKFVVEVNNFFVVPSDNIFAVKKNLPELPERLKEARGSRSQKAIAEVCGMKQQEWARYEHGDVLPRADKLQQICRILAVSADWLLGLTDNPSIDRGGVTNTATARGAGAQAAAGGSIQSTDGKTLSDIIRRIEALEGRQNSRRK